MIKNSEYLSPNHRKLRVGELIKQNLGQIFLRNEAKIPSFNTNLITITEVKMSSDLKSARAYVIPLGGKEIEKTVNTLTEFSYLVRKALSKKLDIKFLPRLYFVGDKSFDYAEKIEKLIKQNKST
tara:strand:- start:816 stop:1190 length:375 start_codon:yes stop_codon:yes gene_type:complete